MEGIPFPYPNDKDALCRLLLPIHNIGYGNGIPYVTARYIERGPNNPIKKLGLWILNLTTIIAQLVISLYLVLAIFRTNKNLVVSGLALNHRRIGSYGLTTCTKRPAGENLIVRGRTFFTNELESLFHERRRQLSEAISIATYVGTTADFLSSRHRKKVIGETVHWFKDD